jgi:hypothetical protein
MIWMDAIIHLKALVYFAVGILIQTCSQYRYLHIRSSFPEFPEPSNPRHTAQQAHPKIIN